ncbi:MAG: hypothetical protein ACPL7B_08920 [Candidatus Poribacteria bacterium]
MGKGGLFDSKWITVILVIVLVVLAVILFWMFKTGGFDKFRPKKTPTVPKPAVLYLNPHSDHLITTIDDLSWTERA